MQTKRIVYGEENEQKLPGNKITGTNTRRTERKKQK